MEPVVKGPLAEGDLVADFDGFAPLRSIAVDLHFAAIDSLRREGSGLVEPGCPEPEVEADRNLVLGHSINHSSHINLGGLSSSRI